MGLRLGLRASDGRTFLAALGLLLDDHCALLGSGSVSAPTWSVIVLHFHGVRVVVSLQEGQQERERGEGVLLAISSLQSYNRRGQREDPERL